MSDYEVLKTDGKAKRARLKTVHGTIETPVFMNVGTIAAIKGAVATTDLQEIHTQVELSNTYHLHLANHLDTTLHPMFAACHKGGDRLLGGAERLSRQWRWERRELYFR